MARLLFTVEDTFSLEGHGLVLFPGIVPIDEERFKIGDPLSLKKPNGVVSNTAISGIEMLYPNPRNDVVVLLKNVTKDDVPIGTEVWSVDS